MPECRPGPNADGSCRCRAADASADTAHKLEDSILTRARALRLATLGQQG